MENKIKGWAVICLNHPNTGNDFISAYTFAYTRKEAIAKFMDGGGSSWSYWKREYNFKAVKATQTITIN